MKLFRDEDGQTLVFTAFLACCLMGFMALAIDVGAVLRQQRRLQIAADAAAIAAGWSYYNDGNQTSSSCGGSTGNIICAADAAASNNGVTDSTQVQAHISPTYGQHTGAEYVEVIIQQPSPTIFMGAFAGLFPGGTTSNYNPMTVGARAVVGIVSSLSCDHQLDPSNAGSLSLQGGASVNGPNCIMQVNSTSPQALCFTGQNSLSSFNVIGVQLVNAQAKAGSCNKIYGGAQTGVTASPDPFASITGFFPDATLPPDANSVCGTGNTVIQAAPTQAQVNAVTAATVNTGGFQPSSPASPLSYNVTCFNAGTGVPTTLSNVTLGSGVNNLFIFQNGVVISGGITVNGTMDLNSGMFCQGNYNSSSGKCTFSGSNSLTITAPASTLGGTQYAWNGMAFVMPSSNNIPTCDSSYGGPTPTTSGIPNSCVQIQFGSGSGNLTGMVYTPGAAVYLQDNGGGTCPGAGTLVSSLITADLYVKGSLCITDYSLAHVDSPLVHVSLVE
jgi:Flp pilus assembly protein TadG